MDVVSTEVESQQSGEPARGVAWWWVRVPTTIAIALWSLALLWGVVIGLFAI